MRPLWQRWPTILAIIAFALNVDLVVIPVLTLTWGIPKGLVLFLISSFFATAEPTYWNWYAKWVVRNTEPVQRIKRAFREQGIAAQLKAFVEEKFDWFVEHARTHANGDEGNERLRQQAVALIKRTHIVMMYPTMLVLGCVPSGWPVAIFLQRIFPVPGGFVVFLMFNAFKTYFLGLLFLGLPFWAKITVWVGALSLVFLSAHRVVRNVNALDVPQNEGPL